VKCIKEILEEKGTKQTWLGNKRGKSHNMLNSYAEKRQQLRLEVVNRIAETLNVDIKTLIRSNN